MTDRENQSRLDTIAMNYLTAVETGDFYAITDIWVQAENDSDLADMLHGLNAELSRDQDTEEAVNARGVIDAAIEKHMPSAEVIRPTFGPLTVAEVAEHIRKPTTRAHRR